MIYIFLFSLAQGKAKIYQIWAGSASGRQVSLIKFAIKPLLNQSQNLYCSFTGYKSSTNLTPRIFKVLKITGKWKWKDERTWRYSSISSQGQLGYVLFQETKYAMNQTLQTPNENKWPQLKTKRPIIYMLILNLKTESSRALLLKGAQWTRRSSFTEESIRIQNAGSYPRRTELEPSSYQEPQVKLSMQSRLRSTNQVLVTLIVYLVSKP